MASCGTTAKPKRRPGASIRSSGKRLPTSPRTIGFYRRALGLADQMGASEYQASIRLELAQRHLQLDEHAIACAYALAANEQARELDDLDRRRSISQFLLDHLPVSR
jgi:hypothetical protein